MRITKSILTIILISGLVLTQVKIQAQTITDKDGNVYKTVTIGTQVWMQSNLNVSHYQNGDSIRHEPGSNYWGVTSTGVYCYFNNTPSYGKTYGKLYNYYCIVDPRQLCPNGWHVPTQGEWKTLITYLGGDSVAGGKLKETGTVHWETPNTGATNKSGFSALPGGYRMVDLDDYSDTYGDVIFDAIYSNCVFWSSSTYLDKYTWEYTLTDRSGRTFLYKGEKEDGASVRCIKN